MDYRLEELERRVSKLENVRDQDYKEITENNKQLALIVKDLKNITKSMESLAENWKVAIEKSNEIQHHDKEELEKRIITIEKNVTSLSTKIDDRTIVKNSKLFDDIKWIVISGTIGAIVTLLLTNFLK